MHPTPDSSSSSLAGDFISTYADYADVLEAPREVHEAVALTLLAAVLNPKVTIGFGALTHTIDLWTLILSGSGLGRNTLVGLAYPVLDACAFSSLVRKTTWGSGPAFYQDVSLNPSGLLIWPELSHVLKTLNQSQFNGAKEWLTDRFDNTRIPEDIRYRATGRSGATPPIVFTEAPRLNILATSSVDWFVPALSQEDTTGGFVPRWLIVRITAPNRVISKPRETDARLIKPLADHLVRACELTGVADLSRVEFLYDHWYVAASSRFNAQPNTSLAVPFFNRLRALVLKLAVIYEVSATCSLSVSPEAMCRAIAQASSIEKVVFDLLPTGLTASGFALDKMEQQILQAGGAGMTSSEFTRANQDLKTNDRKDRLNTLAQGGRIRLFQRTGTGGRHATILVHSDFVADHTKDFPGDTAL